MSSYRDRRWKVHHCEFTECKATHVRILDELKAEESGIKVVGIATSQGCAPGVSYRTNLNQQWRTEKTYSVEDTNEHLFTFGKTISLSQAVGVMGTSPTFGVSQTSSSGHSFSASVTEGWSNSFTTGSSQMLDYTGLRVALIIADIKQYKFKNDNVNVEYTVTCDDGDTYTEQSTLYLAGYTYGQTHYTQRHALLDKDTCTRETEICIDNIRGNEALDPLDVVLDFENCFKGNATNATVF